MGVETNAVTNNINVVGNSLPNFQSQPSKYCDIESDSSDCLDESDEEYGESEDYDDDLDEMSDGEKEDIKYLSIFDNSCIGFDEQIMTLESVEEFKKWRLLWLIGQKKGTTVVKYGTNHYTMNV